MAFAFLAVAVFGAIIAYALRDSTVAPLGYVAGFVFVAIGLISAGFSWRWEGGLGATFLILALAVWYFNR